MNPHICVPVVLAWCGAACTFGAPAGDPAVELPHGVRAVWNLGQAYRESSPSRERICLNGLWRWRPAQGADEQVPAEGWGYFKVPGCWPGITDYMQKDFQTLHVHPAWQDEALARVRTAWYQRQIVVPPEWAGRRIALQTDTVNSHAAVYLDATRIGEIRFPAGEVDLTATCRPGATHLLSLLVTAMPLRGVMLSYNDTNSAREVQGSVARRGLCGDVWLASVPAGPRLDDLRVTTSVRQGQIAISVALEGLGAEVAYGLHARIRENGQTVHELASAPFRLADVRSGRFAFAAAWRPPRLWDIHTPEHQYEAEMALLDGQGRVLDTDFSQRFGFREFWINGRDFYLNGTRIFLSAVPLDNAQVGAFPASYAGARESLERLQSFGINFVYTHNYGCEPGAHLSFAEILRAADDVGMLVALSQPHFGAYDWKAPDAERNNGYARHAEFYAAVAGSHPSVVAYATSHNATGYSEDMNPERIDGLTDPRDPWALNNAKLALRAEAIVSSLDPSRIVYHHSSGNLSSMHTSNFYPNWAPVQELDDWFEHWSTQGVKPVFLCEYGAPFGWDWAMYRGWYQGARAFGSASVPWDYCLAEWNAQFLGDAAYRLSERERTNLRWEAQQFRSGNLWKRWDYPYQIGERRVEEMEPVQGLYTTSNWRAFRTWGLSANSPWEHHRFWRLRDGVDKGPKDLPVDWEALQRPGFSPDYVKERYERMDLAYERSDWLPTDTAEALVRNNRPLLAYIGGKPDRFTSKDHVFRSGETVQKQLIVINNSREAVSCAASWSVTGLRDARGDARIDLPTGEQQRLPLRVDLPVGLAPGEYTLAATFAFSTGETQQDRFAVHVLPRPQPLPDVGVVALFDPPGDTAKLLDGLGVRWQAVSAGADLSAVALLVIGRRALGIDSPAPDLGRVRDGLKVIVFEQSADVLEKRLGFRVATYGLRQVFRRVPDHPLLAGLDTVHLRDWRGAATLVPPRLEYDVSNRYSGAPVVRWCGMEVPRVWRCGCQGSVASVLIEKPARGDFLPICDGGFGLQYSPLMEYREGRGMVLFCQLDVTARSETDPVADTLARNVMRYAAAWRPRPSRQALYVGTPAGREHLEQAGITAAPYDGGPLTPDQVLVVGEGGGPLLAPHRSLVAAFLKAGGHLLALGLDAAEANSFLPVQISTRGQEHIAAFFKPAAATSLLAGIGPADVHNRDPREVPLVDDGATAVGNGLLAQGIGTNVVFCQFPPYSVIPGPLESPAFVVSDQDAVAGKRSALLVMGTVPWAQFVQKTEAGEPGKTYTFAVLAKALGGPVRARLEVERAARPWDRVVRGDDVELPADQWTELHLTFKVEKAYPEGWSAYLHCGQPGARLRLDEFLLYEGNYQPASGGTRTTVGQPPANRLANPGFEAGVDPWRFSWRTEQQNLRRTYRRTSFLLTRLLANAGVRGETPLLSRVATPTSGVPRESVVRNGDFRLDTDHDGKPDHWEFSTDAKDAAWAIEPASPENGGPCLRVTCPGFGEKGKGSVMLAQQGVSVQEGQWYRISFRAKSAGLERAGVTLALQNTTTWQALLEYTRFAPPGTWRDYVFLLPAKGTATSGTRFQIWHGSVGTLWLADLRMAPCEAPSAGRWTSGLYLDPVQEWDDPYRFFRW